MRWKGYGPDDDSWVGFDAIAPPDARSGIRAAPHPDIRRQILEFDAVRADELDALDEAAAQMSAATSASLSAEDRVIADYEEEDGAPAWLGGSFLGTGNGGAARVKLDDGRTISLPRADAMRMTGAPAFDLEEGDIVKAPMDEESIAETGKYWSYGTVLGWVGERRELLSIQFDEDDLGCPVTMPPFEVARVVRLPAGHARKRRRAA